MSKIYLAINYGAYEGWKLIEYETSKDAVDAMKNGEYSTCEEWKILKELEIRIIDKD